MFPKKKRIIDRALLDSYREKDCVVCGSSQNVVAHHKTTRGAFGDDVESNLWALCFTCHREVHDVGAKTFAEKYGLDDC